jgi:AcrR family transcriptional regulator
MPYAVAVGKSYFSQEGSRALPKTLSETDIAEFRDRLCDVAERLFADQGLEAVTMRELAGELGVSPMTPYRYFKDKDAILAAVRTRAFNAFSEALETAFARKDEGYGDHESITYVDFALAHPHAYKLMFDVNQPTFNTYPELLKAMERARATMTVHLEEQARLGRFKGDVEVLSHGYWATLHGAVMLQLTGMLRPPIDARTILAHTLAALERGAGLEA